MSHCRPESWQQTQNGKHWDWINLHLGMVLLYVLECGVNCTSTFSAPATLIHTIRQHRTGFLKLLGKAVQFCGISWLLAQPPNHRIRFRPLASVINYCMDTHDFLVNLIAVIWRLFFLPVSQTHIYGKPMASIALEVLDPVYPSEWRSFSAPSVNLCHSL